MNSQKKFVNLTLFKKLFVLLFLSTSLPVSVLGYMNYDKSSEQIEKVTNSLLLENLQQNKERLDRFFSNVEEHSNSIIGSRKMEALLIGQDDPVMRDQVFLSKAIQMKEELNGSYDLSIYPPVVSRYESYSQLQVPSELDSEWLLQTIKLNGKGFWFYEREQFVFARLIRQMSDLRPLGVIRIVIPATQLYNQLIAPRGYQNFKLYLTDMENRQAIPSTAASAMPQDFVASIPLALELWHLAASIPKADLIGPVQPVKRFSVLFVIACIMVISILLVFVTNSFVMPIKHIAGQMKKAQFGQLRPTSDYMERTDEVGQLIRSYNSLIHGMQELIRTTKQAESEKSRMEMQMLIHQINPHFLYNTLDAIKWKAYHVKEESISEMVTALSNILRYSINNGEEFTTLEREIEHVKSYLKVELLRHNNSFQTVFQVQSRLLNVSILKLILQPIVENAVRHGVGKLQSGQGKILVRIFVDDKDIMLIVEDNGPGWADDLEIKMPIPPLASDAGGIGLFNVKQRLQNKFGCSYGLTIRKQTSGGCQVQIRHPFI